MIKAWARINNRYDVTFREGRVSLNKDIKNKVAISELEGKVLNMGNIFDSIAAKATIEKLQ